MRNFYQFRFLFYIVTCSHHSKSQILKWGLAQWLIEPSIYKLSSRALMIFCPTRAYIFLLILRTRTALRSQHPSCLFTDVDCCISVSVHLISARTAVNSFG